MMPSMAGQSDEWIAAVLSYVRNSSELGNKATVITPEEVKRVRAQVGASPKPFRDQEQELTSTFIQKYSYL